MNDSIQRKYKLKGKNTLYSDVYCCQCKKICTIISIRLFSNNRMTSTNQLEYSVILLGEENLSRNFILFNEQR